MTTAFRIPGDLEVPTRFFGRFTWKDLLRLGLPVLLCFGYVYQGSTPGLGSIPILLVGFAAGLAWYGFRPYQRPLDMDLYHGVRWLTQKRWGETSQVETVENDHVVLETGAAVAVIEVSPTNLEMKTEAEQGALHAIYRELFDSISYPVHIHSRQKQFYLNSYIEHIENQQSSETGLLQDDYIEHCETLADTELSQTKHYIVLRVDRDNLSWLENQAENRLPEPILDLFNIDSEEDEKPGIEAAVNELDSRCHDTIQKIDSSEITADRVSGEKLDRLAEDLDVIQNLEHTPKWTTTPQNESLGEYRRTLYISELPANLELGWTLQLLRTNGLVDITQTVQPVNSADASKQLQRLQQKLNAEIDSLLQQGYRGTNKLEGLLDDTEWFLNLLADREDQPVEYGVYITVHHPDKEKCLRSFEQVCNRLDTLQIDYREPFLRTDHAQYTCNPVHGDHLNEELFMPAGSAATGFPFATQTTDSQEGVIYGVDKSDETPVLLNRFNWISHSMARMGMVGSGKSYAAKIELLRASLTYDDLQIIVVDPKREYQRVVHALGGQTYELGDDTSYSLEDRVVGYTVGERGQQENVELLAEAVERLYKKVSQNQEKTLVVIDEARILLNDETGRQVLNRFVLEGRDTNTAITLVTQNASHFTYCREGREILDNMPGKVFMRHDRVPESVVEYFDLSQREKQELFELKTGTESKYSEALLRVSGQINTRLRIQSTPQEHAVIETGENQS